MPQFSVTDCKLGSSELPHTPLEGIKLTFRIQNDYINANGLLSQFKECNVLKQYFQHLKVIAAALHHNYYALVEW